jgi:excisionase family DNA binding protein
MLSMTNQSDSRFYLTVPEAAEFANMSDKTIRRRIADGSLEASKAGRLIRIHVSDLEAFLQATNALDSLSDEPTARSHPDRRIHAGLRALGNCTIKLQRRQQEVDGVKLEHTQRIILLYSQGASVRQIAPFAGLSHSAVHNLLRQSDNSGRKKP